MKFFKVYRPVKPTVKTPAMREPPATCVGFWGCGFACLCDQADAEPLDEGAASLVAPTPATHGNGAEQATDGEAHLEQARNADAQS